MLLKLYYQLADQWKISRFTWWSHISHKRHAMEQHSENDDNSMNKTFCFALNKDYNMETVASPTFHFHPSLKYRIKSLFSNLSSSQLTDFPNLNSLLWTLCQLSRSLYRSLHCRLHWLAARWWHKFVQSSITSLCSLFADQVSTSRIIFLNYF